jgi:membrane-bound metal-dependent hydrolase YbcI (DUF457 family)
MLPDLDLVLREVVPAVDHHGVTHTLLFVASVSVAAGYLVADRFTGLLVVALIAHVAMASLYGLSFEKARGHREL